MAYSTRRWEKTPAGSAEPHRLSIGVPSDIAEGAMDEAEVPKRIQVRPPGSRFAKVSSPVMRRSVSCEAKPKPIIRRRERSLPSPPERRRLAHRAGVRFVDSRGLNLEDVKVFEESESPLVPEHVLFRILMNAEFSGGSHLEISLPLMKPLFPQMPGDEPEFVARISDQRVCLERVLCFEFGILGIVQVLNLAFEKEVHVRYSFTSWKSFSEMRALWVSHKHVGDIRHTAECDTFHFHLPVPPFLMQPGTLLEFALRYRVLGTEFWDNNGGQNYRLTCHSYKVTVPKECEDSMIHFI